MMYHYYDSESDDEDCFCSTLADERAIHMKVSLKDLYNGNLREHNYEKKVPCKPCKGIGCRRGTSFKCQECDGDGRVIVIMGFRRSLMECETCDGRGKTFKAKNKCKTCSGLGFSVTKAKVQVPIKPGMTDGEQILIKNAGNENSKKAITDLVVILKSDKDETFHRQGNDLYVKKKITFAEALCGYTGVLEHLDGRKLVIKTAVGEVIESGTVKMISGEGMPKLNKKKLFGDLYFIFDIEYPEKHWLPDETLKQLAEALPPKPIVKPLGEEVSLSEFDPNRYKSSFKETHGSDDDYDYDRYHPHDFGCNLM